MTRRHLCPSAFICVFWILIIPHCSAAENDPRRPPAIETQNVPPLPDELANRLHQYDSIRSAGFADWAPDGRGILIQTRFGNTSQVHRVYEPGGRREQTTFYEEPVAESLFVPKADDGAILLSFSEGGSENDQIFCLEPKRYSTTLLTDGKSRNQMGPPSHDGRRFTYGSNRRNGRDTDWYVSDCRSRAGEELLLEVDGDFWYPSDWSLDGGRLLMQKFVSVNESYPAVIDVATKKLTMLPLAGDQAASTASAGGNNKTEPAAYRQLCFAPDGKSVYLATDALSESARLMQLDLAGGKYTDLSGDIPWEVEDVEVEPRSGRVAFTANVNGRSVLYVLESDKPLELKTPLGAIGGLQFSPDGKQLGFTLARANEPPDAYSLELASEKLTRWTYSEIGGLDPAKFVEPSEIEFESFDGRKIPAWIYRPRGASPDKPAAVLIQIHGGPEGQYRPIFSPSIQYYASEMGLAVICPNVRGSSGYGKSYLKLDNAERREDSVKDIGALLDWIARQPELDAQRVAVEGGSYGGYMVLASLVHYGERIKAGIDIVGIANFITFLERTAAYRRDLRRAEYGDERDDKMRAVFERINPTAGADRIRSALLVAHGRNDPRVPFFEAQQIAERVQANGGTVWTVYGANEGHGFAKRDNRDYLRAVSVMFLEQQLGLK